MKYRGKNDTILKVFDHNHDQIYSYETKSFDILDFDLMHNGDIVVILKQYGGTTYVHSELLAYSIISKAEFRVNGIDNYHMDRMVSIKSVNNELLLVC